MSVCLSVHLVARSIVKLLVGQSQKKHLTEHKQLSMSATVYYAAHDGGCPAKSRSTSSSAGLSLRKMEFRVAVFPTATRLNRYTTLCCESLSVSSTNQPGRNLQTRLYFTHNDLQPTGLDINSWKPVHIIIIPRMRRSIKFRYRNG